MMARKGSTPNTRVSPSQDVSVSTVRRFGLPTGQSFSGAGLSNTGAERSPIAPWGK